MERTSSDYFQPAAGASMILGLWLLLSGVVLADGTARTIASAVITGALIAGIGAYRYFSHPEAAWPGWVHALLGFFAISTPWIMGFADRVGERTDYILVGVALIAVGFWEATHHATRNHTLLAAHRRPRI